MKYWLGVDIGTGGSRALLVEPSGRVVAGYTAPHEEMQMPAPLWAEQRPDNWWEVVQDAIRGVLDKAAASGDDIAAVGLSGQMHGMVLLGADQQVIRPAIIWCDQRSQRQADWINETAGAGMVLEQTANPALTSMTVSKLLWVRDHEPAHYDRARQMLLPKDYIRFRLTGEYATEVSGASGTGLLDVVRRRWASPLIERLGIDQALLPPVFESPEVSGRISEIAAGQTGLKAGTPVVGGAGDQAASAVGSGIVEPGQVSVTIGTSGVVFSHLDEPACDPQGRVHTFCHAVPGKWHLMGVTQGAGLSLQWFRNQLGQDLVAEAKRQQADPYELCTALAAEAPAGSDGLFWLPYLMGERTPHLDAEARGGWIGLTAKHTRAHLLRAMIEGVSYSLRDCLEIIRGLGVEPAQVRASGGGARSEFWRGVLAGVFDCPIVTLQTQEGSAYGAALLAMAGSGLFQSVPEACAATIREIGRVDPDPPAVAQYERGYTIFRSLYPKLKDVFPTMSSQN